MLTPPLLIPSVPFGQKYGILEILVITVFSGFLVSDSSGMDVCADGVESITVGIKIVSLFLFNIFVLIKSTTMDDIAIRERPILAAKPFLCLSANRSMASVLFARISFTISNDKVSSIFCSSHPTTDGW